VPFWQDSPWVHALPSLHVVPLATTGLEHAPLAGSHVPARWHWSEAVQATELPATQAPAWHVSFCVQELPSLHAVPSASAGLEQAPVLGLHDPAEWHWSDAVQVTGSPPTQLPL
jgi:hypothetical protein